MIIFKVVLIGLFVFILFNLFSALFIMLKGPKDKTMSHYIGRRLLFSVGLVIVILVALATGIIQPNARPY